MVSSPLNLLWGAVSYVEWAACASGNVLGGLRFHCDAFFLWFP